VILRNIRDYSPNDTASHPRSLESSGMILSKTASQFCVKYLSNSLPVVEFYWTVWSPCRHTTDFLHIIWFIRDSNTWQLYEWSPLDSLSYSTNLTFFYQTRSLFTVFTTQFV
jgi:hypothetical protein